MVLKWTLAGRLYAAEVLKCVVRSERNQQVMCEAGLPRRLFSVGRQILRTDDHPLTSPFFYVLERMSAQAMAPKQLRSAIYYTCC